MKSQTDIRPSPIAGQWYTRDPRRLAEEIDAYIDAAETDPVSGDIIAIMVPHAGHRYSGPVAGFAFAAIRGMQPDVVAVVSPMHYVYHPRLITSAHQAYATPLGVIPIDMGALDALDERLEQELGEGLARVAEDPEHSLEIELPFLQRALESDFKLLPVMMRDQSAHTARTLGNALAGLFAGQKALLVASSDLSHFYPQPVAEKLDSEFLHYVEAFDPQGVLEVEERGKGFACGRGAVASVLWAARGLGANRVQVLNRATSGDVTGDFSQVVGYASAVVTRDPAKT
jgi:AmmeMemoRadiSam system protein B